MILRREFLLGVANALISSPLASAQIPTKVIVLGKGVKSSVYSYGKAVPRTMLSLAGWLVCNGAQVERGMYPELFDVIGESFGGDGMRAFKLPLEPLEMRGEDPVRGIAICPAAQLGDPGDVWPFDIDSGI
jgi:hypothetical protein